MVNLDELKKECRLVLEEERVRQIIGYKQGSHSILAAPAFFSKVEEVDQMIWNPVCIHNLSRFLVDDKQKRARIKNPEIRPLGIVVKGCDSRAINVLLQEKYITRDDVYLIGVSCENTGMVDENKLAEIVSGKPINKIDFNGKDSYTVTIAGKNQDIKAQEIMADRCLECKARYPLVADVLLGEKIEHIPSKTHPSVEKIESLSSDEKWAFWKDKFDACIRCYACRSVCPMCYCDECVVDTIQFAVSPDTSAEEKAQKIKWIERSAALSENANYHMVRAIHLAGRCIDCGECERVCPVNIPIRLLNKKLEKDAKELFDYEAGFDSQKPSLISSFNDQDPEEFIR